MSIGRMFLYIILGIGALILGVVLFSAGVIVIAILIAIGAGIYGMVTGKSWPGRVVLYIGIGWLIVFVLLPVALRYWQDKEIVGMLIEELSYEIKPKPNSEADPEPVKTFEKPVIEMKTFGPFKLGSGAVKVVGVPPSGSKVCYEATGTFGIFQNSGKVEWGYGSLSGIETTCFVVRGNGKLKIKGGKPGVNVMFTWEEVTGSTPTETSAHKAWRQRQEARKAAASGQ